MATINPHTTRATGTVLTAAIYNTDHQNHITNANALNAAKAETSDVALKAYSTDVILKSLLTTRGDMIRRNATDPERFAAGSVGKVLTMGANDPDWEEPDFKFLESGSLTGANATIVLTSYIALGYSAYLLTVQDAHPVTDNATGFLRVSTNAGSSFIASGYISHVVVTDGSAVAGNTNATGFLITTAIGNQVGEVAHSEAYIKSGPNNTFVSSKTFQIDGTPVAKGVWMAGAIGVANVDALRLVPSAGNWSSGSYRLWGIKES